MEDGALRVTWGATDAASGVDGSTCELRVREDEGAWQPFSAECTGDEVHSAAQPGHVYTFRFSATDNVSNGASTEAQAGVPRVTKYYYSGGRRVAMRQGGVVYYLHGDHLGSTALVTGQAANVVARRLHLPYGEPRYQAGTLPTDFGFTGQRDVPGTGLVFMHARYYDARLGRFVQADTVVPNVANPQEWNRYSYCLNSPVTYIDPNGHQIKPPEYQPFAIQYTGTTGPYVPSADATVQYDVAPTRYDIAGALTPIYDSGESFRQAVGDGWDWFRNADDRDRVYGPNSSLTQDIMHDPGIDEFREKWAEAQYQSGFCWGHTRDDRTDGSSVSRFVRGTWDYATIHLGKMGAVALGFRSPHADGQWDAVGGTIGSLDKICAYDDGDGWATIKVYNTMNWKSLLRIPGSSDSFEDLQIVMSPMGTVYYGPDSYISTSLGNVMRGFGGATPLKQTFIWREPMTWR